MTFRIESRTFCYENQIKHAHIHIRQLQTKKNSTYRHPHQGKMRKPLVHTPEYLVFFFPCAVAAVEACAVPVSSECPI